MKNYFAVMLPSLIVAAVGTVVGVGLWLYMTFTIMTTMRGDEWLILREEQAKECKESGCAVFSENEFHRAMQQLLGRVKPSSGV